MLISGAVGGLFLALQKSRWQILGWGNRIAGYLDPFLFVLLSRWDHKCYQGELLIYLNFFTKRMVNLPRSSPERLTSLHPWRQSKLDWKRP